MRIFLGMRQLHDRDPDEFPETYADQSIVKVIDWALDYNGEPEGKERARIRKDLMNRLEAVSDGGEVMFLIQCLVV